MLQSSSLTKHSLYLLNSKERLVQLLWDHADGVLLLWRPREHIMKSNPLLTVAGDPS